VAVWQLASRNNVSEEARLSAVTFLLRAAIVCSIFSIGNPAPADPALHKQARRIMGTFCEVQVYDSNASRAEKAIAAALDEMQRVDRLLSNYNAGSELSMINREAARSPVRASTELYGFLKACRGFHDQTLGAFDPTVGPLVRAWGFFTPQPAVSSAPEIAAWKSIPEESARVMPWTEPWEF
jgi:thiamine biosynthesis lipoprotein